MTLYPFAERRLRSPGKALFVHPGRGMYLVQPFCGLLFDIQNVELLGAVTRHIAIMGQPPKVI